MKCIVHLTVAKPSIRLDKEGRKLTDELGQQYSPWSHHYLDLSLLKLILLKASVRSFTLPTLFVES